MAQQSTGFLSELASAAIGVATLVVGDRESPKRFNLTTQGLAGSFIAVLVVTAIGAVLPLLLGQPGGVLRSIAAFAIVFVLQAGCASIALWQVKRLDGFVPYLVVDNWSSFYVTLAGLALNIVGVSDEFLGFPIGVLIAVVAVNIGRLVIGLAPLQVAMFVVAQVVGYFLGGAAVSLLLVTRAVSS